MNPETETIAALATPPGESGLAVVRISGPEACAVVTRIYRTPAGRARTHWQHGRACPGRVVGDRGEAIDTVVLTVFRAPSSYTGEDTAEISCHGSPVGTHRVLAEVFGAGARAAQPGEFTRRAFLNGKLDLIQAEAVAELIHARSELQQRAAQRQLDGGLSAQIGRLAREMLSMRAEFEANIDFIEEGLETLDYPALRAATARHIEALDALARGTSMTRRFFDGYRVVLTGAVNAGKSSLFNRLLEKDHAIVTELPGTTRDVLRESMVVDGVVFVLHDTAGLREEVADRIETIGMDRAFAAIQHADVIVRVVDGSVCGDAAQGAAVHGEGPPNVPMIIALNKSDVHGEVPVDSIRQSADGPVVRVSARTGEGVDDLRAAILAAVGGGEVTRAARERFIVNARVSSALESAREAVRRLEDGLSERRPLEILAADAGDALAGYETATGVRYEDGLLDMIFSRFCLGK